MFPGQFWGCLSSTWLPFSCSAEAQWAVCMQSIEGDEMELKYRKVGTIQWKTLSCLLEKNFTPEELKILVASTVFIRSCGNSRYCSLFVEG